MHLVKLVMRCIFFQDVPSLLTPTCCLFGLRFGAFFLICFCFCEWKIRYVIKRGFTLQNKPLHHLRPARSTFPLIESFQQEQTCKRMPPKVKFLAHLSCETLPGNEGGQCIWGTLLVLCFRGLQVALRLVAKKAAKHGGTWHFPGLHVGACSKRDV